MSLRRVPLYHNGSGGRLLPDLNRMGQIRAASSSASRNKQQSGTPSSASCPLSRREAPLPRQRRNGGSSPKPLLQQPPVPVKQSSKQIPSSTEGNDYTPLSGVHQDIPTITSTQIPPLVVRTQDVLDLTERHNKRTSTLVATMRLGDSKLRTRASTLLIKSTDELCEMMDTLNANNTTSAALEVMEALSRPLDDAQARLQAVLHLAVVRHPLPSPMDAAQETNDLFLRIGSLSRVRRQYISTFTNSDVGESANTTRGEWERGLGYLSLLAHHRPTTLSIAPESVVVELVAALEARHKQQQAESLLSAAEENPPVVGTSSVFANAPERNDATVWRSALSLVQHLGRVGAEPPTAVAQWAYTVAGKSSGQVGWAVRQINNLPVRLHPTANSGNSYAKNVISGSGGASIDTSAHTSRLLPYAQRQVYTTNNPCDDSRHTSMPLGGCGVVGSTTMVKGGWTTEPSPSTNDDVGNDVSYADICCVSSDVLTRKGDNTSSTTSTFSDAQTTGTSGDTTLAALDRERAFAAGVRKRRLENALRITKEKAAKQRVLLADAEKGVSNSEDVLLSSIKEGDGTSTPSPDTTHPTVPKTPFNIWDDISKGLTGDTFVALRQTIESFMVDRDERFSAKLTPRRADANTTNSTASVYSDHQRNIITLLLEDNAAREVVQNAWGLQAATLSDSLVLPTLPEEEEGTPPQPSTSSATQCVSSITMRPVDNYEADAILTIRGAIGTLSSILRVEGMMLALHVRSDNSGVGSPPRDQQSNQVSSSSISACLDSMSELFTHLSHLVTFIVTELPGGINHHHRSGDRSSSSQAMMMRKVLLNPLMDLRDALVAIVEGVSRPLFYQKGILVANVASSTTTTLSTSISSIQQLIVTLCTTSLLPPLQTAITSSAFLLEASSPQLEDHVTTHRSCQARSLYFTEMIDGLVSSMTAWRDTLGSERAGMYRNYCRSADDDHHQNHGVGCATTTSSCSVVKKNLLLDLAIARHLPLRTFSNPMNSSSGFAAKAISKKKEGMVSAFQRIYTEGLAVSESNEEATSTSPIKTSSTSTSSSSTSQLIGNCILRFALVDMAVSMMIPTTHIDPSKWDTVIGQIPEAVLSEVVYGTHRPQLASTTTSPLDLLHSSSIGIGHVRRVNHSLYTLLHRTTEAASPTSPGSILQTLLWELGPGNPNDTSAASHHHVSRVSKNSQPLGDETSSLTIERLAMEAAMQSSHTARYSGTTSKTVPPTKGKDSSLYTPSPSTATTSAPSAMSLLRLLQNEPSLQSNGSGGLGVLSVVESACEECLFDVAVATDHIGVPIPTAVFSSILGMYSALPATTTSSSISAYGAIATRIVRNTTAKGSVSTTTQPNPSNSHISCHQSSSLLDIFRSYLDNTTSAASGGSVATAVDPWALAWVRKCVSEPVGALFVHPNITNTSNNVTVQKQTARTLECLLNAGKHIRVFNAALLLVSSQNRGGPQQSSIRTLLNELHNGTTLRTTTDVPSNHPAAVLLDARAILTYSAELCSRVGKEVSSIERNSSIHTWLLSECFKSWDDDLVGSLMFAPTSSTSVTTQHSSLNSSTVNHTVSNSSGDNVAHDDGTGICGVDTLYGCPGALSAIPPPYISATTNNSVSSPSSVSIVDDVVRGLGGSAHDPIWVIQELLWNSCVCITLAMDGCALIAYRQFQSPAQKNTTIPTVNSELYTQLCGIVSHLTLVSSVLLKSLSDEFSKPAYSLNRNDERGSGNSRDRNGGHTVSSLKMWIHRGERLAAYQEVYNILPQLATGGLWRLLRACSPLSSSYSSALTSPGPPSLDDASLSQFIVVESRQRPSSLWSKSLQLLSRLTSPPLKSPPTTPPPQLLPSKQQRPIRIELLIERLSATINYSPLPYRDRCMLSMRLYAYARALGMETHRHTLEETMGNFYESCCLRPYFKSSLFASSSPPPPSTNTTTTSTGCESGDVGAVTSPPPQGSGIDQKTTTIKMDDDDTLFDGLGGILTHQKSPAEIVAGRIIASNPSLFIAEGAVPSWCNAMRQLALVSLASSKADTNNMLDLLEANARAESHDTLSNSDVLNLCVNPSAASDDCAQGDDAKSDSSSSSNERLPMNRNMHKSAWTLMHRLVGGGGGNSGSISDAIKPSLPATGSTSPHSSQSPQLDSTSVAFSALKMSLLRSAGAVQLNEVLMCSADCDPNQLCRFNELLRSMRRDHTGSTWAAALSVYSVRAATVGVRQHHRIILSDIAFPVNECDDDIFRNSSRSTLDSSSSATSQHNQSPHTMIDSNKFTGTNSSVDASASVQAGFKTVHQQLRRDCALLLSSTRHALTPKEVLLLCKALSWPSHVPPPLPNRPFIPPQSEEAELASEDRGRAILADVADLEAQLTQNDFIRKSRR